MGGYFQWWLNFTLILGVLIAMQQRLFQQILAVLLMTLLSLSSVLARTIECASRNYRYEYCRVKTYHQVKVNRQISRAPCIQGRTWGYDRHGIWVDEGCHASFQIDDRDGDDDSNVGGALAAAAVVGGLAILGATLGDNNQDYSASHHHDRHDIQVPRWAVGTYRGYNPRYDERIELRIHADGSVVSDVQGYRLRGYYDNYNEEINIQGNRFAVEPEEGGFRTIERNNPDNIVHYTRLR